MSTEFSMFAYAQQHFDGIAEALHLSPAMRAFLRVPMRELHFTIPVQMDDGSYRTFQAFRVQYNDARGPAKGGVRFTPDETIDGLRYQAMYMTYTTALADLPVGGGKGGVICDSQTLSMGELERLSRGYVRGIAHFIGADKDVPSPDVNVTPQIMSWMLDEFEVIHGRHAPGVVTGKPMSLFGSLGRGDAIARGGICVAREAGKVLGMDLRGATAAIQGYGNVGQSTHQLGCDVLGLKVVAVSDHSGGVYNPDGLSAEKLLAWKTETGRVIDFPGVERITNAELLELPVDVLFPAALENVITRESAPRIKARMIVGLSNGPIAPEAEEILNANGLIVLPNCLCNAGGKIVSYFEQAQNAYNFYWSRAQMEALLEERITRAFRAVHEFAQAQQVSYELAGCMLAVRRVADAVALRGWVR